MIDTPRSRSRLRRAFAALVASGALLAAGLASADEPSESTVDAPGEVEATEIDPNNPPPLPDVDAVMDWFDDLYRADSSHSRLSMHIVTENWERTLELEQWTRGEDEALIVIRAPAREAGTATLRNDDGLWNYAPRADSLMRVPSGLMGDGWMGSHFTNDDLMRETEYDDDYTTTLAWDVVDGELQLVATSIPTERAAVVYTQVIFRMRAADWMPLRAEYYDGDELIRTMTFSDLRDLGDRTVPMRMTLQPMDAPDERTEITYEELEFDSRVDRSLFTHSGLRRAAQRGR